MNNEPESFAVVAARIEANLNAVKSQLDYSERSSAQLVKMVDERFSARFDALDRRLGDMERSRDTSSAAFDRRFDEIDNRLTVLERFNTRIIGIAVGVSFGTGGVMVAILKAIGGP